MSQQANPVSLKLSDVILMQVFSGHTNKLIQSDLKILRNQDGGYYTVFYYRKYKIDAHNEI